MFTSQTNWLPVEQRIIFKIALITFKASDDAPQYIVDLLEPYNPARTLRSSSSNILHNSRFNPKGYGGHSFVWNLLPKRRGGGGGE